MVVVLVTRGIGRRYTELVARTGVSGNEARKRSGSIASPDLPVSAGPRARNRRSNERLSPLNPGLAKVPPGNRFP